jgi:hypothetical protein
MNFGGKAGKGIVRLRAADIGARKQESAKAQGGETRPCAFVVCFKFGVSEHCR